MNQSCLHELEQEVLAQLTQTQALDNLCLAYSGGIDSTVLLKILVQLRHRGEIHKLSAIHINHGLHQSSDHWTRHCESLCKEWQVPLTLESLDMAAEQANLEATAREGRYKIFEKHLQAQDVLIFAHHRDDQAETLMLRLLRGAGIVGACGMPRQRNIGNGRLSRPMLDISRKQIQDYAREQGLSWVEDPSNQQTDISRNFLRHEILPKLAGKWPATATNFARFCETAREQQTLLSEVADADLHQVAARHSAIFVNELLKLSAPRQKNLLHHWARIHTGNSPSSREINEVLRQLKAAETGSIDLRFAGCRLRSFVGELNLVGVLPAAEFETFPWTDLQNQASLSNGVTIAAVANEGIGLRQPQAGEPVTIRCRRGGEKCLADYRQKSTSLKKIYQELMVPPWQRQWLPLIYYGETLAAVPGVFFNKNLQADKQGLMFKLPE